MAELAVGIAQDEFERFKHEFIKGLESFREKAVQWAGVLARMSREQVQEVKRIAKGVLSADQVERLVLCGRGELHVAFATRPRSVRASVVRRLPPAARKDLMEPDTPVEVVTPRGTIVKPVGELNAKEINQVYAPGKGRLGVREQQARMLKPAPAQRKIDAAADQAYLFDGLHATSDGKVLVYGRDSSESPGSRTVAVRLTPADLRLLRGTKR